MTEASPRIPRTLLALFGLCILAAALYWVGGEAVLDAVKRCSLAVIAYATAALMIGTVLGAWNCYRIADLRATMTFLQFLPIFWRSWAVGITLPGQVGDFLTTLWQLKGRSIDLNFVAGRLFADKAITLGLSLALASMLPTVVEAAPSTSALMLAGLSVVAALTFAFAIWGSKHRDLLARFRWGSRILPVLAAAIVPAGVAVNNAIITTAKLLVSGFAYWVVFHSISSSTPTFVTTAIISQSAGLIAYIPVSFNGLGTVEVSAVALFGAIGLDSATVLSAYLILRATTLAAAWLPVAALALLRSASAGR